MENWPITVTQAPAGSEAEFASDIVLRFKASERGAAAVLNVSPNLRDQIDLGFDVPVELCFDLLQVFPDRLEHLDETGV